MKKTATDNKKIAELEAKIKELEELVKRTAADFQNYKKRIEAERSLVVKLASTDLILELLPILDNFRRSADHAPADGTAESQNWITGVQAIERHLEEILKSRDLERIAAETGDAFNPAEHEAVAHEPDDSIPADHIIEVMQDGYRLAGRLLRPAKVKVSKGTR